MRQQYPVSVSCCVRGVSAIGYLNWLRRPHYKADKSSGRHGDKSPLARIRARTKRKFVVTTGSKYRLLVAPGLVQMRFIPEDTNQLWSEDITCIATDECWLQLAALIELFSRQVGLSLQPHKQVGLVKAVLAMA